MKQNNLGKSALKVTEIGFGCWAIGGGANWGEQEDRDSCEAVQAALEVAGVGHDLHLGAVGLQVEKDELALAPLAGIRAAGMP